MSEELMNKPVACLTLEELLNVLDERYSTQAAQSKKPTVVYLRGQKEVANFLKVSVPTVARLRAKGVFDDATIQRDKILLFDRDKLLECLANHKPGKYGTLKKAS